MDFSTMTIEEMEERKSALVSGIDEEGADLDAIEAEVRAIKEELENRKNAEAKKAEIRASVAAGNGEVRKSFVEENKPMSNAEIRGSHEYNVAYANYIKTGNDSECRALLTENVSGTVPVASYVEGRVRTAWERDGITSRVRKTFLKGNVKIGYEISADGAIVHTEAANSAVTEESLTLGIITLVPQSIKKWISISDEVYDLTGEEFLDYIYDELTYRIAKKLADLIIADIEDCGTVSTGSLPAVPKITSTTVTVGLIAQAIAQLSDEAADPVVMMNKATWGAFKAAQAANGYAYDPFEGLPVVFNDSISAFSAATTGVTYAIVGDLGIGAQANFPNGQEIEIKFDDKTKMEYDLVRILGREFVGHAVVAPKAFVKITH
jgi:HK97 family phage major capsid protein